MLWLNKYEALCLCVCLYDWVLGWNVIAMCTIMIVLHQIVFVIVSPCSHLVDARFAIAAFDSKCFH